MARPADAGAAALRPRCAIWGVLNVTPDSFSDGGVHLDPSAAIGHAARLVEEGASVVDIGGASSRPAGSLYGAGAAWISPQQELDRVAPVIEGVRSLGCTISIDTTQPLVARHALALGARIVNDVSCAGDPELLAVTAAAGAQYVVMHSRGRGEVAPPQTTYDDVCTEVVAELRAAMERAAAAGIARTGLWVDPGIGFAKTAAQSVALLANLVCVTALGAPVLVGASRKGFIAEFAPHASGQRPAPLAREAGGLAALTAAVISGASAVRVHDVASARQAVLVAEALARASRSGGHEGRR